MHQQGISHRDLKYENIMFTSDKPNADVKMIDFGLSKKYGRTGATLMHDAVGTVYSMSPEVLQGSYTKQADVWSCGVLTFMLLSSTMPFYGKTRKHVMKRIVRGSYGFKGPRWKFVSEGAKDFVTKLLRYEPDDRPTASDAMVDQWYSARLVTGRRFSISNIPETMDAVQASIENFSSYSTLKQLALMVVAHRSTSEEVGFLRRMFRKYDNQKGCVTLAGFKEALSEYSYSDVELERLFAAMVSLFGVLFSNPSIRCNSSFLHFLFRTSTGVVKCSTLSFLLPQLRRMVTSTKSAWLKRLINSTLTILVTSR